MNKNNITSLFAIMYSLFPFMLTAQSPQASCEQILVQTIGNELVITGLDLVNSKMRIYDSNYDLIFSCEFDCESTIAVPNVTNGDLYHFTFELFGNNFGYVNQDNRTYSVGDIIPISIDVCPGSVQLKTQAEVDAFCGCEIVLEDLHIGGNILIENDISDISNLNDIKIVGREIRFSNTKLTSLDNFYINHFNSLSIVGNNLMTEINSFNEIISAKHISIFGNDQLTNINGFHNLKEISEIFSIRSNGYLTRINAFEQLEFVRSFDFSSNDSFLVLDEFPNLSSIGDKNILFLDNQKLETIDLSIKSSHINSLYIRQNPALKNITKIDSLFIEDRLEIIGNTNLNDCCFLADLLDDDLENGNFNGSSLTISDNSLNCISKETILENCEETGTTKNSCEDLQITSRNNQLTISNITARNPIVKIFDHNWQLVFECNANCEESIILEHLTAGDIYHTDVQFYDENWQFICLDKQNLEIQGGNPPSNFCEEVSISIEENTRSITIGNLNAPIEIVKVFDPNWQFVYECNANCESEITVTVGSTGLYHTDIQFYDENWQFLCGDQQDVEVIFEDEPCDTSVCQGNVNLGWQAAIDAFCGCEVIEGDLTIRPSGGLSINNIDRLSGLKRVKGSLTIYGISDLQSLESLSALTRVDENFSLYYLDKIKNVNALSNLTHVGGILGFLSNSELEDISGLNSVEYVGGFFISGAKIISTDALKNVVNEEFSLLNIRHNPFLRDLSGLENVNTVDGNFFLLNNPSLENINSLENLKQVSGTINIEDNSLLTECCIISPLIEAPTENQLIRILGNGEYCNPLYLMDSCNAESLSLCEEVVFNLNNGLSISNLTAPIQILKVFDNNYTTIYECFAKCEETIDLVDLGSGIYHVNFNLYDENWEPLCERIESVEVKNSVDGRNTDFLRQGFALYPNPSKTFTYLDLGRFKGEKVQLDLFNQFGQRVIQQMIEKVDKEKVKIDLTTLQNGIYFLQIKGEGKRKVAKRLIVNRLY